MSIQAGLSVAPGASSAPVSRTRCQIPCNQLVHHQDDTATRLLLQK